MAQLPAENSTWLRAVRRAADAGRLSHAVILTGSGDLLPSARYLAAAHVCEGREKPCLHCRHCRKVLEDINPRDSWRASKAFRKHIAVEMAKRALIESVKRCGGEI